ncbi:MAG: alanine racemase [Alphaproteobacteria bacterium]|nr:alanine racemase [Alphaproteobacteria bacterium]
MREAFLSVLTIDLAAIEENYRILKQQTAPSCTVAAVVKADAYGLGIEPVAVALQNAGASSFFVALLCEAAALRRVIGPQAAIFVLEGFEEGEAALYEQADLIPVLNHVGAVQNYAAQAQKRGKRLPAIIQIETGMNRIGAPEKDLSAMASAAAALDLRYIMSHFACSDEAGHEMNTHQWEKFRTRASAYFAGIPMSLANSSGIFRSNAYHFDMVRPGMALYGLNPLPEQENPMRPVICLDLKILQVKTVQKGEICGYNGTYRFDKESIIGTVSAGYADGLPRSLSNRGTLFWKGYPCPIRGRVSMDLISVDFSALPGGELPEAGDYLEAVGANQSADALGAAAGTIGYEILTSLGRRYRRIYKKG